MANRLAALLPPHVTFPKNWEHVATHRVGPYITRVIHRLPDGALHIWSSRRHRKSMGPVVHLPGSPLAQSDSLADVEYVNDLSADQGRRWRLWS